MTLEVRCRDAGCPSCSGRIRADSQEQLEARLAAHLSEKHGIKRPTETIMDYLMETARER